MASFNKVILVGNMTTDPELKQTTAGISVCSFSIAVNRRFAKTEQGQQNVDFINIVTWRQQAEFVSRYFKKGNPILICGQLQTRTWSDNQGQKRYATEVVADEVSFVGSAQQSAQQTGATQSSYTPDAYGAPAFNSAPGASFEEIPNDSDLPF
jgi:single-strand DNA-binding protein